MRRLLLGLVLGALLAPAAHAQVPPTRGIQVQNSSGNVAAGVATATLPAVANRVTYICGFSITSTGATAAAVVSPTVAGLAGGTMTFTYAAVAGATAANQPLVIPFGTGDTCLAASAPNTTIVVSMPSLGAGNTNTTVNAWGYQR
jgi:hypothetical protein